MPGSPSSTPRRIERRSGSAGSRLHRWLPQRAQKHLAQPSDAAHSCTCSAPESSSKLPAATRPPADDDVPVRRWQRVQWQYHDASSGAWTAKETAPHRQWPVSGSGSDGGAGSSTGATLALREWATTPMVSRRGGGRGLLGRRQSTVVDHVGDDQGGGEEEQAEDEVAGEAVSLAGGDARGPERDRDPDDRDDHPAER